MFIIPLTITMMYTFTLMFTTIHVHIKLTFIFAYLDVPDSSKDGHVSLAEIFKDLFFFVENWHL